MSSYARPVDQNSWTGGEALRPIDTIDAREWLEAHGDVSVLETVFADSIRDA